MPPQIIHSTLEHVSNPLVRHRLYARIDDKQVSFKEYNKVYYLRWIRWREVSSAAFCSKYVARRALWRKNCVSFYTFVGIMLSIKPRSRPRGTTQLENDNNTNNTMRGWADEQRHTDRNGVTLATGENWKIRKLPGGQTGHRQHGHRWWLWWRRGGSSRCGAAEYREEERRNGLRRL